MAAAPSEVLIRHLTESRERLLAFIRSKVSDPDLAEDVLQESVLKALRAAPDLRDEERLVSWFYQIVRNAISDAYRRKGRAAQHLEEYAREVDDSIEPEDEAVLCACFEQLIPTLKPAYAEVIQLMDLGEAESEVAAEQLGITRANLKVRHHRARQQLRERLQETCRTCAAHGCLDCTCRSRG